MEIIEEQASPQRRETEAGLRAPLDDAFADDSDQPAEGYTPPAPMLRLLLKDDSANIIGHTALYRRSVVLGEEPCTIGMIGDVAIAREYRRQGLCRRLIQAAHSRFTGHLIDFSILFAYEPNVYRSSGYALMKNETHFLDHDGHWKTFVYRGSMYCELRERRWPHSKLDLRGPTV